VIDDSQWGQSSIHRNQSTVVAAHTYFPIRRMQTSLRIACTSDTMTICPALPSTISERTSRRLDSKPPQTRERQPRWSSRVLHWDLQNPFVSPPSRVSFEFCTGSRVACERIQRYYFLRAIQQCLEGSKDTLREMIARPHQALSCCCICC
jgi:hypothetical protein